METKINYTELVKEVSKLKKENERLKKILSEIENAVNSNEGNMHKEIEVNLMK